MNDLLRYNKPSTQNFLCKNKIFILQKDMSHQTSGILNYLLVKQDNYLSKLIKNHSEIQISKNFQEELDYTLENEYYQTENEHHLGMIFRSKKTNEYRKYFFTIRLKEIDTISYGIFSSSKKNFISKTSTLPFLENYDEPNEGEILNFLRQALYGNISFHTNIPNVEVICNNKHLGFLPLNTFLFNGSYNCKFISKEGIIKIQKFVLYPQQNIKIFQPFYETKQTYSILLDTLPEVQKIKFNKQEFHKTPIVLNLKDEQKIEFQNSNKSLELFLKPNINFENRSSNWILFPYMVWDAFHPKFISFWESPKTFGAKLEMNRYLSVINETKQELGEWSFLESKPFFPETIEIEGSLFPPEDTGTGIFQIHFGSLKDYYTLEVEEEKVSLFHFPSSNVSIGNYIYPIEEQKLPRKFVFVTNLEKKTIQIYLNDQQVLNKNFNFDSTWQIVLSFRGKIFNRLNILNHLKIAHTKFLNSEEYKIWKKTGNF